MYNIYKKSYGFFQIGERFNTYRKKYDIFDYADRLIIKLYPILMNTTLLIRVSCHNILVSNCICTNVRSSTKKGDVFRQCPVYTRLCALTVAETHTRTMDGLQAYRNHMQ